MAQKWYKKATVQSAMVGLSGALFVALISALALWFTYRYQRNELRQEQENFDRKFERDSILSELNMELLRDQREINKINLELLQRSFENDSIFLKKQFDILLSEYLAKKAQSERENILARQELNTFLRDFFLNEGVAPERFAKANSEEIYSWLKIVDERMAELSGIVLQVGNDKVLSLWSDTRLNNYVFMTIFEDENRAYDFLQQLDENLRYQQKVKTITNTSNRLRMIYNILNGRPEGEEVIDLKTFEFK